MPRYEYVEGSSSKFWEIEISGASVTTRWGRIGTAGQEKTKDFASAEKAQAEYDALIREKTGKGYREAGAAATSAPPAPRPDPVSPSPPPPPPAAAAPEPDPEPSPAVPAADPAIAWRPELRRLVTPRRDGEVRRAAPSDPVAAWARIRQVFARHAESWRSSRSLKDPDLAPVLRAVLRKMDWEGDGLPPAESPETEGALLVVLSTDDNWGGLALDGEVVTLWERTAGLAFAVEALQASLDFDAVTRHTLSEVWLSRQRHGGGVACERVGGYRHWWYLRHRLAAAGEAEWAAARDTAARLRAGAPLAWRIPLAYLFPETGWAEEDARELLEAGANSRWQSGLLLPVVREAALVSKLVETANYGWSFTPGKGFDFGQSLRSLAFILVDNLGLSAVAPLSRLLDVVGDAESRRQVLDALVIVPAAEIAEAMVAHVELREAAAALTDFAARFPRLAMPVLAARAARGGPVVSTLLAQTVRRDPQIATELLPGLPDAARRAIEALLDKNDELPPEADPGDLPPVLASPPWQRKGKREAPAALDLPPLPWQETMAWPEGEEEGWRRTGFMNRGVLSDA